MKRAIWIAMILALSAWGTCAETTRFPDGVLDLAWIGEGLSIRVVLSNGVQTDNPSPMWVVTLNARRFDDGVHSWQIHLSTSHQSLVMIPNDFLVAQRFSLQQVGVGIVALPSASEVALLIPRTGVVPGLVAPGDLLEIHALWIRQKPLVAVRIPDVSEAGSGGQSEEEGTGTSLYMPAETVLVVGTPIRHTFALVDKETGQPIYGAYARIALVRITESLAEALVDYAYCEPSGEAGLVTYEFETGRLEAGTYDLIVWVGPPGAVMRHRLELVSPAP